MELEHDEDDDIDGESVGLSEKVGSILDRRQNDTKNRSRLCGAHSQLFPIPFRLISSILSERAVRAVRQDRLVLDTVYFLKVFSKLLSLINGSFYVGHSSLLTWNLYDHVFL